VASFGILKYFANFFLKTIQLKQVDCATWWPKIMPLGNLRNLAL
jgi:hypothetical protein